MANFILVHGSFHGAWNWHKVVPLLEKAGHRTMALDMPGHGLDHSPLHSVSLADCVQTIISAIDSTDEKAILVAHSRNGMVISQVAELRPHKIDHLIYLAAYLIPNGKCMMDYGKLDTESLVYQNILPKVSGRRIEKAIELFKNPFLRTLIGLIIPTTQKVHHLQASSFKEALYHDCPDEITELAKVLITAEPNFPGFETMRLTEKNYGRIPKTYIECLQDRAVTLELQRKMQRDSPCDAVYQLDSSHSPFFSMPQVLVDLLVKSISHPSAQE
ncbi:MAG: alpha/beta fold hydrolase [Flavobacteriales bacterium]|nr:alpha/beta fold hydrolase [Flavobacteriales bacterium]